MPSGNPQAALAGIADSPARPGDFFTVLVFGSIDIGVDGTIDPQDIGGVRREVAGEPLGYGDIVVLRPYRPWWAFWRPYEQRAYRA